MKMLVLVTRGRKCNFFSIHQTNLTGIYGLYNQKSAIYRRNQVTYRVAQKVSHY